MLNALYNLPRTALRNLILWALGPQTATYDPAAMDKVISGG
jgi:hypothetical protein